MTNFTHLHVHSQYSLLDGAADILLLIKKAKDNGMKALALTDHGNLMGIKEFHIKCIENGIKPLIGCEVYMAARTIEHKTEKIDRSGYHLIIIAKNKVGYKNLIKLCSISHLKGEYYRPRIDKSLLEKYSEGLIITSACLGGEVPKHILNGNIEKAEETIVWYKSIFKDDYYLELMRHKTDIKGPKERIYDNQIIANEKIVELAKKHDVKVVATNDVHFVNKEDARAQDILICLNTGKDLDDDSRIKYTQQEWLKTKEEMSELFEDIPEAITNTMEIADKVEIYELNQKIIMPEFPIPDDFATIELYKEKYSEHDLINEFGKKSYSQLDNDYEKVLRIKLEADYLQKLVFEGAKKCYGEKIDDEITERIKYEINTIKTMGFPGYFLIVQDFVNKAKQMNVLVGPGRGSAAGSVVAYCTGITNIDPIKYKLLFERFLNPDRISMPDVDIDFDDDNRDKVINYVINKYGQDKVAHICIFQKMKAKMAVRDVGRVLKVPLTDINILLKKFPETTLDNAYNIIIEQEKKLGSIEKLISEYDKNLKKLVSKNAKKEDINKLELYKLIASEIVANRKSNNQAMLDTLSFACTLEGSVRQSGIHPCGILIGKNNLTDHIPLMQSKDTPEIPSTQYDGNFVEDIGLLKMDFLGLRTLSIIKDTIENIKHSKNKNIDIDNLDLNDKKTFEIFQNGNTTAVFQFESEGMKKHLKKLKPNKFEDLVAMNALYRPGPMEYIPDYIDRKHGKGKITYDHPTMEKYLSETYGITVFQEQVMLLSRELAGFTRGESDTLRKSMGKKDLQIMKDLRNKFQEGCLNNPEFIEGCKKTNKNPEDVINKIWKDWESFAKYAFNKSHSVCYAQTAYITAFLKANYPAEFMAANLSRNLNDSAKIMTLMKECTRMKIEVLGPSINESFCNFTVNNNGQIRFGMGGIKNVGNNAVESIIEERKNNNTFCDIFDFFSRINLSVVTKKSLEALIYAGAFDEFNEIKRHHFFHIENNKQICFLEELIKFGNNISSQSNVGQTLFGELNNIEVKTPEIPEIQNYNLIEFLNQEKEHIGIYLSGHPLDPYKVYSNFLNTIDLSLLNDENFINSSKDFKIIGYVTEVQEKISKAGNPFGIISIIDYSGSYSFSIFGKDYIEYKNYFIEGIGLLISARFKEGYKDKDTKYFTINGIRMLDELKNKYFKDLKILIQYDSIDSDFIENLTKKIEKNKGDINLNLCIYNPVDKIEIKLFSRTHRVNIDKNFIDYIESESAIEKFELS